MILIEKTKADAIKRARSMNKNKKYGYRIKISSIKYKGKAKRSPGKKEYTAFATLKPEFAKYRKS